MTNMQFDTICRCAECGREEHVLLVDCLQQGWPHCHEQDMEIVNMQADIQQSYEQAIRPITLRVIQALRFALKEKQ